MEAIKKKKVVRGWTEVKGSISCFARTPKIGNQGIGGNGGKPQKRKWGRSSWKGMGTLVQEGG